MKKIILYTLLALVLSACKSTSSDTKESITLSKCNDTDNTTNYQVLQSGDTVSKPETLHNDTTTSEPEVEIFHTEDGMKKVCIKSGTAVILR